MKRLGLLLTAVVLVLLVPGKQLFAQQAGSDKGYVYSIIDSLGKKGIILNVSPAPPKVLFTENEAINYLKSKYGSADWVKADDPLRGAIGELLFIASHRNLDSLTAYINKYPYDSIDMPWVQFYKWDSLKIKIPVVLPAPFSQPADSLPRWDTLAGQQKDSSIIRIRNQKADSLAAYRNTKPTPTVVMKDTVLMVASQVFPEVPRYSNRQPFRLYRNPFQSDSISSALKTLANSLILRDSSILKIRGITGPAVPVMLNSRSGIMERYWLKNDFADSVTVWVGTIGRDTLGVFLEDGIMFRRPVKQTNISNTEFGPKSVNSGALQNVKKVYIKPRLWRIKSEANFIMNQTYISSWVAGGQSSVSAALDITGFADYKNDAIKMTSSNFIRIKYGLIKPGREEIRKSLDNFEINSKVNHKAFGKFDFSAVLLFKTQLTVTKDYTVVTNPPRISNFMNPATLTVGFGLDYKPDKKTSINVSPLSYKATMILDTASYDETKYGIPKGRRVLNEPGASVMITNEYSPFKMLTLTNRLQLFTNYIDKPQNIDIDWELIATAKLNWFTDMRVNTHMIYNDNILIPLVDSHGKPILDGGVQRKGKRLQFKELVGLSFVFRF